MRTKLSLTITLIALAAILLTACGTPAYAQTNSTSTKPPRTLAVNGAGKVYLVPDIAYISIGVHTENKDAAEAVGLNTTTSKKVADALKKLGVKPEDIQTTNFNIYPQQQYDQNGKLEGLIYVVDNTVYVTLRDLTKLGDLLGKVVEAGANSISGISFDVADRTKAMAEARKLAVADAQSQAKELATAAGVTLGAIQSLNTYGATAPAPVFDGKGGGGALAMSATVPVSPGQMFIQVDVSLVYEIQ
jgi:uncharacterized protein YggE